MTIHPLARIIHTPQGRYERVLRSRRKTLECGHHPDDYEVAWQRIAGAGSMPDVVCHACMVAYVGAFKRG